MRTVREMKSSEMTFDTNRALAIAVKDTVVVTRHDKPIMYFDRLGNYNEVPVEVMRTPMLGIMSQSFLDLMLDIQDRPRKKSANQRNRKLVAFNRLATLVEHTNTLKKEFPDLFAA